MFKKKLITYFIFSLLISSFANTALAITIPNLSTQQILQSQINVNRLNDKTLEQNQHNAVTKPAMPQDKTADPTTPTPPSKEEKKISFILKEITLTGVTAFPIAEIEKIYKPYYHKKIHFNDLRFFVDSITALYQSKGYLLSQAVLPSQKIIQGHVNIRVIEGYIGSIETQGNIKANTEYFLNHYAKPLCGIKPINEKTLRKYDLLLNSYPGIKTQFVLHKGKIPLTSDILILATQTTQKISLTVDNKGTDNLGQQRVLADVNLYSLFRGGDAWSTSIARSFNNRLTFFNINTVQPVDNAGSMLLVSGTYSKIHPGGILIPLEIDGITRDYQMQYSRYYFQTEHEFLKFTMKGKYFESNLSALQTTLNNDSMRVIDLAAYYQTTNRQQQLYSANLHLTQGLDMLGAVSNTQPNAKPHFTAMNLNLLAARPISTHLSYTLSTAGQYSFQPLYSGGQFAYGGDEYGRAFDDSELTGDQGLAGKFELEYNTQSQLIPAEQYYGYVDHGIVWQKSTEEPNSHHAGTTGIGVRMFFNKKISADISYNVAYFHTTNSAYKHPRIFMSINFTL